MISSWQRVGPNTIPHTSKATGIYLNSMLAVHEAQRAGYDEAILLTHDGYVADGSGESIFVITDGVISTPDLSASILQGITRETIIELARSLGYTVEEKRLIRADLYMADEVFMCGTAVEVTPIRSIDDQEIGPPGPITLEIQKTYRTRFTAACRSGPTGSTTRRERPRRHDTTGGISPCRSRTSTSSRRSSCSRCSGPAGSRSGPMVDRFEEMIAERVQALIRSGRVQRNCRASTSCARLAGIGPGDEVITSPFSFVASANCFILRGRHARLRGHRPAHAEHGSGSRRGGDHRTTKRDRRGRHVRVSLRSSTSSGHRRPARPRLHRGRCRSARRRVQGRARSGRTAHRRSSASTRTSRSRPARAASW